MSMKNINSSRTETDSKDRTLDEAHQMYFGKSQVEDSNSKNQYGTGCTSAESDKRLDLFVQTIYANEKGNLSTPTGEQAPINTPEANSSTVSNNSIRKSSRNVNSISENQTETENFKTWFGDWQNDPAKASKVVNPDGTPKVMYHGTNAEFTVFDRAQGKKKVHLNVFGDGNYFTALREGASRYGANVVEAYLDIKNPYVKKDGFNTVADQIASEFGIARDSIKGSDVSSFLRQRGYDGRL